MTRAQRGGGFTTRHMSNRDFNEAWLYHNATKHSLESVRADRYTLCELTFLAAHADFP